MNPFNKIKTSCLLFATCLGLAAGIDNAKAGLQTEQSTNGLAVASTNTFALYGDRSGSFTNGEAISSPNSYIDASKGDDLWASVGGFFTNSTANASNVVVGIYHSVNLKDWNSDTNVTLTIPGNTTNWVTLQLLLQNAYPGYGMRTFQNPNAANVTAAPNTLFFQGFEKNGI